MYAIIPADGHADTMATVYSSYKNKEAARSAARGYNARTEVHKVQVIECEAVKGARINMRFVGNRYPRIAL